VTAQTPATQPTTQPTAARAQDPAANPDWSEQASLFQLRQPAFWLFTIAVVIGGWLFLDEELSYVHYSASGWVFSLVLLAIYAVPVFFLIYYLDVFEREPLSLLLGAVAWGALVAVSLAGPTNTAWLEIFQKVFGNRFAHEWGPAIIGPAIEETLKYLGVVVISLIARHEIEDIFDGFVYGAMIGLGFTVVEDMSYFFNNFIANAGGASEFGVILYGYFIRVIAGGLYTHVLFTGISGMGLAYYVTRLDQPTQRRRAVAVGAFAVAVGAHFFWNSPILESILGNDPGAANWIVYDAIKGLPFLIFLAFLLRLATGRERAVFKAAVAGEIGTDVMSQDDVRILGDLRLRRSARRAVKARKGPLGERLMARIQQAQLNLGLISTGTRPTREADLARTRDTIRALRAQLAALSDIGPSTVWTGASTAATSATAGADEGSTTRSAGSVSTVAPALGPVTPGPSAERVQSVWASRGAATIATSPTNEAASPAAGGPVAGAQAADAPVAGGETRPTAPAAAPGWIPTHRVPPEGMPSWDQPDPSRPMTPLAGTLPIVVARRIGDWAQVVASNGWTGWVDARRVVPIPTAAPPPSA
jgi:RsiW-degrading membrane proteinase PrsW (M82 family)